MRAIGLPYPEAFAADGTDAFMVSAQLNFRGSARYDDELRIGVRTAYFGTTSFRMATSIRRGDDVLVEATTAYVNGDCVTHVPRALPAGLVALVSDFEVLAPEQG